MKAILLTILAVILLIFAYNAYTDYQRFNFENYQYQAKDFSALQFDQTEALLYHQKIQALNGYIITQWSARKIDVRNPEDDTPEIRAAVHGYTQLLGEVVYLETKLLAGKKSQLPSKNTESKNTYASRIINLFKATKNNELSVGSGGALVYEVQKVLNKRGYQIPEDGNFQNATYIALRDFENKHSLFPDGKLDLLTLEFLLEE